MICDKKSLSSYLSITKIYSFYCHSVIQQSAEDIKLFISKKEGEYKVNFDGIPFCIDEERVLDCQYGCHY